MRLALSIAALVLSTLPAFAVDAVTYEGTLGNIPIVAEITQGGDSPVGRYFYRSVGADIPLNAGPSSGIGFSLLEEAPCGEDNCPANDDYVVEKPPIGATWDVMLSGDGEALAGTWTAAGKSKTLQIRLKRVAMRTLPPDIELTPYNLHDLASMAAFGRGQDFSAAALPYDFIKMDTTLGQSPVQTIDGSSFRYVTDPRTQFAFPRVVSLADGSDPTIINQTLATEQARMNMGAFDCLSGHYAGFGWNDGFSGGDAGSLGGYDGEQVQLTYLSPTVISWNEAGSLYCTEAHPDNHSFSYNYDVRTGQPLDLSKILNGWVMRSYLDNEAIPDPADIAADPTAYHGVADANLVDWVRSYLPGDAPALAGEPDGDQTEADDECGLDDLVGQYLAVRFEADDEILFTLEGLPNVIFSCAQDLMTVPLADVPAILAPTAAQYFPSLKAK